MNLSLAVILAGVGTAMILPRLLELLEERGIVQKNYRDKSVPIGAGVGIVIGAGAGIVLLVVTNRTTAVFGLLYLTGVLGAALFGLFDDLVGNTRVKGLRGHFSAILQGRLTSGGLKAASGTGIALFLSGVGKSSPGSLLTLRWIAEWLVGAVLIALMTNFLNLADLRPGRAGKLFLILAVLTLLLVPWNRCIWLLPMMAAVLAYLPWDLRERLMMGDTGANVLGISLGAPLAWGARLGWQVVIVLGLVAVHVMAERISLSEAIESIPLLRRIDRWGRRDG